MFLKSRGSIISVFLAVVLLLTGVMLATSGCGDEYIYDPSNPDFVPPVIDTGPVSIGADAFFSDYNISTVGADSKYANRDVEVRGCTVTSISSTFFMVNILGKVIPADAAICIGLTVGTRVDVTGLVDEYSVEDGVVPILNADVDVG